jgi:hypothetical protein
VSHVQSLGSKEEVGTVTSVLMLRMNDNYFYCTFFVTLSQGGKVVVGYVKVTVVTLHLPLLESSITICSLLNQ